MMDGGEKSCCCLSRSFSLVHSNKQRTHQAQTQQAKEMSNPTTNKHEPKLLFLERNAKSIAVVFLGVVARSQQTNQPNNTVVFYDGLGHAIAHAFPCCYLGMEKS